MHIQRMELTLTFCASIMETDNISLIMIHLNNVLYRLYKCFFSILSSLHFPNNKQNTLNSVFISDPFKIVLAFSFILNGYCNFDELNKHFFK